MESVGDVAERASHLQVQGALLQCECGVRLPLMVIAEPLQIQMGEIYLWVSPESDLLSDIFHESWTLPTGHLTRHWLHHGVVVESHKNQILKISNRLAIFLVDFLQNIPFLKFWFPIAYNSRLLSMSVAYIFLVQIWQKDVFVAIFIFVCWVVPILGLHRSERFWGKSNWLCLTIK